MFDVRFDQGWKDLGTE